MIRIINNTLISDTPFVFKNLDLPDGTGYLKKYDIWEQTCEYGSLAQACEIRGKHIINPLDNYWRTPQQVAESIAYNLEIENWKIEAHPNPSEEDCSFVLPSEF
ncbi:MAG: hypothetical protein J7647_22330 [Cyanobacteria bacterium SBLK]|nr:hypothetical protein [Cyanobacteria bacterium SBLK]